jgi:predicted nucleic acid-binding protein
MPPEKLFLDSSALVAAIVSREIISAQGAARALLLLAEVGEITIVVSEQVIAETERTVARKVPQTLPDLRQAIRQSGLHIVRDPSPEQVMEGQHSLAHPPDVAILLAAMQAGVDYLVTLNRKHFLDDPGVAQSSGLRIGTPGDALAWVRGRIG